MTFMSVHPVQSSKDDCIVQLQDWSVVVRASWWSMNLACDNAVRVGSGHGTTDRLAPVCLSCCVCFLYVPRYHKLSSGLKTYFLTRPRAAQCIWTWKKVGAPSTQSARRQNMPCLHCDRLKRPPPPGKLCNSPLSLLTSILFSVFWCAYVPWSYWQPWLAQLFWRNLSLCCPHIVSSTGFVARFS